MEQAVSFHPQQRCGQWDSRLFTTDPRAAQARVARQAAIQICLSVRRRRLPRSSLRRTKVAWGRESRKLWRGRRVPMCRRIPGRMRASRRVAQMWTSNQGRLHWHGLRSHIDGLGQLGACRKTKELRSCSWVNQTSSRCAFGVRRYEASWCRSIRHNQSRTAAVTFTMMLVLLHHPLHDRSEAPVLQTQHALGRIIDVRINSTHALVV